MPNRWRFPSAPGKDGPAISCFIALIGSVTSLQFHPLSVSLIAACGIWQSAQHPRERDEMKMTTPTDRQRERWNKATGVGLGLIECPIMHVSHHGSTVFTLNTPTFLSRCGRLNWLVSPPSRASGCINEKEETTLLFTDESLAVLLFLWAKNSVGKYRDWGGGRGDDSRRGGRWEKTAIHHHHPNSSS